MPMRALACIRRLGPALALALVVTGCTKSGQFDPTDFFSADMFDTKKQLKGERKPLFPEGVPGAETGVPPDLVKGYQAPPETAVHADAAAAAAPEEPKPKPKPVKKKVVAAPPASDPAFDQKPVAAAPTRIEIRRPPPQAAPPVQAQSASPAASVWPDPPRTGQQPAQNVWPDPPPVPR